MDKKIVLIIILIICTVIVLSYIGYMIFLNGNGVIKLNKKVSKLQESLLNDKDLNFAREEYVVFLSVSDSKEKAYVTNGIGNTLKEAIDNAKSKMKVNISLYKINPEWVRIDVVNKEEVLKTNDLKEDLFGSENEYRKGLSLDKNYDVALLENELNVNKIIDYKNREINLENLNKYLNSENKNLKGIDNLPDEFISFSCISYMYDEKEVYRLGIESENYGRKEEKDLREVRLIEIMENASEYLIDCVDENGKFIYRYNPLDDNTTNTYNILRHEGTVWSMLEVYKITKNKELKENIELATKFVVNKSVKDKDENTSYIIENKNNEIKLGANGIGILMFIEYMETFNTDEYKELVLKLGNGILDMQNEDGSYYHVYMYPDFKKYEEYRTVYYDGEATFALAKLYEYTKDEKYLKAAEKALDYFYENNYEKHKDHWIEYAVNEVTKYNPKKEYFELGLKNVRDNLSTIVNTNYCNPINLELLTVGLEIYDRASKNNIFIDDFDVEDLISAIYYRADYQLNGLFYKEIAMYFKKPSRIVNSFFTRDDDFRVRIDDVQHNINGYYNMFKNYKLIEEYSKK